MVSIAFPERGPFGVPRKSYKLDKRMPVHRIVTVIFRSLKVEASQADPRNYTLQTFGGVILNDQAPLVVYGLGSLLQNWQLKLVPKPPVRKATMAVAPGGGPGGAEFPILVVFGDEKFTSKAQRVALSPSTRIDTVITKLCEAQKVKHPSKFVLQTLDGVSLQSNFNLETYGLGKRFKKWELKLVPSKDVDASKVEVVPDGVKYAWVAVDDTLSLLESKEIVRKLDWALARTSTSARNSLKEMQDQLRKVVKRNSKIQRRLDKKDKEAKGLSKELAAMKLESARRTKPVPTLTIPGPASSSADGQKSSRKSSREKTPRDKTPREKTPREKASAEPKAPGSPAPVVPPRRGKARRPSQAAILAAEEKAVTAAAAAAVAEVEKVIAEEVEPQEEDAPSVEAPKDASVEPGDAKESSATTEPTAAATGDAAPAPSSTASLEDPPSSPKKPSTPKAQQSIEVDENGVAVPSETSQEVTVVAHPDENGSDAPPSEGKSSEEKPSEPPSDDKPSEEAMKDAAIIPATEITEVAPAEATPDAGVGVDGEALAEDSDSDPDSSDEEEDDDDDDSADIEAAANAAASTTAIDLLEMEQQLAAKHEEALSNMRKQYESELSTLRAELDELRAQHPKQSARGHHREDKEHSVSEHSTSEKEKPVIEESIPAAPVAPAPPPPPPSSSSSTDKPSKKERSKKDKKDTDSGSSSVAAAASGGGIGTGVLDAISNKKFALKKVDQPSRKKKGGDDFLRDALEKRFVAMNLDDVEDLDTWDDDLSSGTTWTDASAWGDDVMRI